MVSPTHKYILVINGKPEGPYSLDELRELGIKPGDFVKTDAMDDYKEAHEVAELRQLFGFQKQALLQYFGSFDQRATAAVIDWFLVSTVCSVLAFIVTIFLSNKIALIAVALSLLVIIPIVNLIYHIVMESSAKQGAYGKQILKIRVCDMQGDRISVNHAAGRNFAKVLSVLTLGIGYLYCFFNKQQQCLHDVVAGTLVVKDRL
ncbi:RDD family protein [Mucilaginibacter sp. UR6-11]|uniref:RDD family protein n=1 Tax=Mucilaginibacter sp. UR6-11 TaxID=1435644 RepID=UPI001E518ED9|nr:RDD family protein [Mucilaginibacter sp. UR6-11]MCC8424108.1 RDD family protein [Mucilaginibacter sp. UR6-11]